jgi:hypothetical protein
LILESVIMWSSGDEPFSPAPSNGSLYKINESSSIHEEEPPDNDHNQRLTNVLSLLLNDRRKQVVDVEGELAIANKMLKESRKREMRLHDQLARAAAENLVVSKRCAYLEDMLTRKRIAFRTQNK